MTRPIDALLTRSRIVCVAVGAGIASLLVAGCGSAAGTGSLSVPSLPSGVRSTPSGTTGPTSGRLGDTLVMKDSGDDIAHVTLIKVFDPATGVGGVAPPDGTRWVGFEGTIVINGSRSGQDPTGVEVIGSDGQTYGADTAYGLSKFDGCTATDAGDGLPPGVTQTFCSGVGLPPGVTVAKVGYSTEDVSGNAPAVLFWTVADTAAPSTPTAAPALSPAAASAASGHLGDTLNITDSGGDAVHVTLVKVLDPATGVPDSDAPPDGTRWVGFDMTISDADAAARDDSATVDVIGSDGQTYGFNTAYHLGEISGCTATDVNAAGQTDTFCAGVGLPPGVTAAQVGYSVGGVDVGVAAQVTWTVP